MKVDRLSCIGSAFKLPCGGRSGSLASFFAPTFNGVCPSFVSVVMK